MQAVKHPHKQFMLYPNFDEYNTLEHLAKQLNVKPETIIEWIVSYELLKYYREINL